MKTFADLDQELIEDLGNEIFSGNLTRIKLFLDQCNFLSPLASMKVVTVAGSNGKGECAHSLAYLAKLNKQSYCLWTSPHLRCVSERFLCGKGRISLNDFIRCYALIKEKQASLAVKLSYYEFYFALFLAWACEQKCDLLILEVGLGGRLDATNAVPSDVVALSSISREHAEVLGDTYKKILFEKIALAKNSNACLSCLELAYLRGLARNFCEQIDIFYQDFYQKGLDYSRLNRLLALMAYKRLMPNKVLSQKEELQLAKMAYVNRVQLSYGDARIYYFGAHNPDGLRKLVQFLSRTSYNCFDGVICAFSKRSLDDVAIMLNQIAFIDSTQYFVTCFEHFKALSCAESKIAVDSYNDKRSPLEGKKIEFQKSLLYALQKMGQTSSKILVLGSNYLYDELYSICQGTKESSISTR